MDTWVAQLLKLPTLDFGSGHDIRVMELSPESSSTLSRKSGTLSLLLLQPLPVHSYALSLSPK